MRAHGLERTALARTEYAGPRGARGASATAKTSASADEPSRVAAAWTVGDADCDRTGRSTARRRLLCMDTRNRFTVCRNSLSPGHRNPRDSVIVGLGTDLAVESR